MEHSLVQKEWLSDKFNKMAWDDTLLEVLCLGFETSGVACVKHTQ